MRKNKIISLFLIFTFLLAIFSPVFAQGAPNLEITITNFNEPIVNKKPSFDYDVDFDGTLCNYIYNFDFVYLFEFDYEYELILNYMNNISDFDGINYLISKSSKVSYNPNNNFGIRDPESEPITKYRPNKSYLAIFCGYLYNEEIELSPHKSPDSTPIVPLITASVNGKESNVVSIFDSSFYSGRKKDAKQGAPEFNFAVLALYEPTIPMENCKATVNWTNAGKNIPDSLILKLMNGSTVVKEQTITKEDAVNDGVWEYDFGEYPTLDEDGNKITYTLSYEEANEGDLRLFNTTVDGFTITNTFEEPIIKSNIKMRSIVDREINNVKYKINYTASIKKYSGNADVTITTTLPFSIDENKSDLDNGIYNPKDQSITWKETIEDIDSIYDYSATKNVDLYATAVLPYAIEAKTVGEIQLTAVEGFSESVDAIDSIETGTGNPKTGDVILQKYLSIGLIGIMAVLIVISIKRKYSTRKSKIQY